MIIIVGCLERMSYCIVNGLAVSSVPYCRQNLSLSMQVKRVKKPAPDEETEADIGNYNFDNAMDKDFCPAGPEVCNKNGI